MYFVWKSELQVSILKSFTTNLQREGGGLVRDDTHIHANEVEMESPLLPAENESGKKRFLSFR